MASCFFASNEAQDDPADTGVRGVGGGAVVNNDFGSEVHVMNCVFVKNVADNNLEAGGGLSVGDGVQVTLSTFYNNSAPNGFGGGLVYGQGVFSLRPYNCIFWANTDSLPGPTWRSQAYGYKCPWYSTIQDWGDIACDDEHRNICAYPEFVDPAADDFRLTKWSPSIEKGNDNLIPLDWGDVDDNEDDTEILPWDLAKKTREKNAGFSVSDDDYHVDQGAYEFQCPACPWDLDQDGTVGTGDLLILLAEWDNTCHPANFVEPETVGTADQLALLAHWGICGPCFGGGGSSSSVWDPQVVAGVQLMGFAGQADYTNWSLNVATNGQAHAVTILLGVILDE